MVTVPSFLAKKYYHFIFKIKTIILELKCVCECVRARGECLCECNTVYVCFCVCDVVKVRKEAKCEGLCRWE